MFFSLVLSGSESGFNANNTMADNLSDMSASIWIKSSSFPNTPIFCKMPDISTTGTNGWELGTNSNHLQSFFSDAGGSNFSLRRGTIVLNDGNWHNLIITKTSGFTLHMYVDGANDDGTLIVNGSGAPNFTNTVPVTLGSDNAQSVFYSGKLTAAQVWNRVLTPTEVSNFWSTGTVPSSPLVSWRMTEGSGLTVNDEANDGNVLTFASVTWSTDIPAQLATSAKKKASMFNVF